MKQPNNIDGSYYLEQCKKKNIIPETHQEITDRILNDCKINHKEIHNYIN